jgi:hypothetical protein
MLFLFKEVQIIKDSLKGCLIVYHCRHALGTAAKGLPFKQDPVHLIVYLSFCFYIFHSLMYVLRDILESNMKNERQNQSTVMSCWDDTNWSDVKLHV